MKINNREITKHNRALWVIEGYLRNTRINNKKNLKVSLEEIQKYSPKDVFYENYDFLDKENISELKKIMLYHFRFGDYIIENGFFQKKNYKPFTCIFETSGKIVVENDLRHFFEMNAEQTLGSIAQEILVMDNYSKQGMLHGYVGNSCPSLYYSEKLGQINIGYGYKKDAEGNYLEESVDGEIMYIEDLPEDSKEIASICTDLWYYSIVDVKVLEKILNNLSEKVKNDSKLNKLDLDINSYNIIEIPAGKWELTHYYGITSNEHNESSYAILKLIK